MNPTMSVCSPRLERRRCGLLEWTNQAAALRDGTVDVALVRLPIDTTALRVQTLYTAQRGALLPADHRLVGKDHISLSDVADEPVIRHRTGATVVTIPEKLEIVALAPPITFLPESAATAYHRHDVTWIPIDDIEPSIVAVAWPTRRKPRLVADFIAHLTSHHEPLPTP